MQFLSFFVLGHLRLSAQFETYVSQADYHSCFGSIFRQFASTPIIVTSFTCGYKLHLSRPPKCLRLTAPRHCCCKRRSFWLRLPLRPMCLRLSTPWHDRCHNLLTALDLLIHSVSCRRHPAPVLLIHSRLETILSISCRWHLMPVLLSLVIFSWYHNK